jgi:hypothetical protein
MEIFDRIGIYSIDFIPYLGFKIAQSHLLGQAQDSLEGKGSDFILSRPRIFDGTARNLFKNNRLCSACGFFGRHKLTGTHRGSGNDITGSGINPWKMTNLILS